MTPMRACVPGCECVRTCVCACACVSVCVGGCGSVGEPDVFLWLVHARACTSVGVNANACGVMWANIRG